MNEADVSNRILNEDINGNSFTNSCKSDSQKQVLELIGIGITTDN